MNRVTFDSYYAKAKEYANTMPSSVYSMKVKDNVSFEILGKMIKIRYSLCEEEKRYKDVLVLSPNNRDFYVTHPVYILDYLKLYAKGRGILNDEGYNLLSPKQQNRLQKIIEFVVSEIEKRIYTNIFGVSQMDSRHMMAYIPCDTDNYIKSTKKKYKIVALLDLICKYNVFGAISESFSNMTLHNYCIMIINASDTDMSIYHKHMPLWYKKLIQ